MGRAAVTDTPPDGPKVIVLTLPPAVALGLAGMAFLGLGTNEQPIPPETEDAIQRAATEIIAAAAPLLAAELADVEGPMASMAAHFAMMGLDLAQEATDLL